MKSQIQNYFNVHIKPKSPNNMWNQNERIVEKFFLHWLDAHIFIENEQVVT